MVYRLTEAGVEGSLASRLKVHCKLFSIERRAGQVRYYSHIGTGNFNEKTARLYTDFSLTSDQVTAKTLPLSLSFSSLTTASRNTESCWFRPIVRGPV